MKLTVKIENYLNESFVNLWDKSDKEKYADEIWEILQKSYEKIGGFKSYEDKEDMIKDSSLWKIVKKDGKIVFVSVYKDKFGRKAVALGTDGSDTGKKYFKEVKDADMNLKRSWAEVSGSVEHYLSKKHSDSKVSNKFAKELTGKEIISKNDDKFHYTRKIANHEHEKVIYGYPKGVSEDSIRERKMKAFNLKHIGFNNYKDSSGKLWHWDSETLEFTKSLTN